MKQRVGNIIIDEEGSITIEQGSGVMKVSNIATGPTAPTHTVSSPTSGTSKSSLMALGPSWRPKTFNWLGYAFGSIVLLLLCGFIPLYQTQPWSTAVMLLIPVPGLLFAGGWCFKKSKLISSKSSSQGAQDDRLQSVREGKIRDLLESSSLAINLETIIAQLGWTEKVVTGCVAKLVADGKVIEDLDIEGAGWVYRWDDVHELGEVDKMTLPIEQRASLIEQNELTYESVVSQHKITRS